VRPAWVAPGRTKSISRHVLFPNAANRPELLYAHALARSPARACVATLSTGTTPLSFAYAVAFEAHSPAQHLSIQHPTKWSRRCPRQRLPSESLSRVQSAANWHAAWGSRLANAETTPMARILHGHRKVGREARRQKN
jgi:hypothetical protein